MSTLKEYTSAPLRFHLFHQLVVSLMLVTTATQQHQVVRSLSDEPLGQHQPQSHWPRQ